MDGALDQLVKHTGMTVPLAGQIVQTIMDSGASHVEIRAALEIVATVLPTLPVSLTVDREPPDSATALSGLG